MAAKELLIVGGVGVGAFLLLNMIGRSNIGLISTAIRYPGKVARASGEVRQVVGDVRSIADDIKGIKETVWGLFDTTDDTVGSGLQSAGDFFASGWG